MRYSAIQKLMQENRWEDAHALLKKVLESHPGDTDALRLAQTCKTMLEIEKSLLSEEQLTDEKITVSEYFSVYAVHVLKRLCSFVVAGLSFLPEKLQRFFHKEKFETWTQQFDKRSQPEKNWMWDLMFWDSRRRRILFASIGGILVLFVLIFVWVAWPQKSDETEWASLKINSVVLKAQRGDPVSQYQLGMLFYRGTESFPRDMEQSYLWLSRAAKAGHKGAASFLQRVIFEKENHQKLLENSNAGSEYQ